MDTVRERLDEIWANVKEIGARRESSAIEGFLNQAAVLLEDSDRSFDLDRATLLRHRARVHFLRDEYEAGIRVGEQALDAFRTLGDVLGQARSIMTIGNCYNHSGKYQESIWCHSQAVEMLQTTGDDDDRSWGFLNLGLSFLGLGVQEPMPSLGALINDGANQMVVFWWQLVFPGTVMAVLLFSLNFLGDGLRDALDPKDHI